ncbi:MAG: hypothetical protein AAF411_10320 [Myxococcota bacterium]
MKASLISALLLGAMLTQVAEAQGAASQTDESGEAARLFELGTELFQQLSEQESPPLPSQWEPIAEAFGRSLALDARPSVAFNLAVVMLEQQRYREASVLVHRALRGDYGDPDETVAERLGSVRRRLLSYVAFVYARSSVPGGGLRLDGRAADLENVGCDDERCELFVASPGAYRLEVVAGADRAGENLTLRAGDTRTVELELEVAEPDPAPSGDVPPPSRRGRRLAIALAIVVVVGVSVGTALTVRSDGPKSDPVWGRASALVSWP